MSTSPVSASNSPVVLIAASESVPGLNVQDYFDRETLVFPDSECLRALEAIMEHRPSLVVLEQIFAATPRGAAIINQIRSDPALSSSEICLFAPDGDKGRVERAAAVRWVPRGRATAASRLPWYARHRAFHDALRSEGAARRGVGRAARFLQNRRADRLPENSAPGPAGGLAMVLEQKCLRIRALVVWASFEPARGTGRPKYQAGLQFSKDDPKTVAAFWNALVEARAADSGAREQPRLARDPLLLPCPGGPSSVL